jgi:hypothetical protein
MNIGEEICGEWLRHVKHCEFIQYNLKTSDVQGEVDVIGLNMKTRTVYACEVAIHLITGLQYNKGGQPENVKRLTTKFQKDVSYLRKAFPDYTRIFMLWSPVVRNQKSGSKHNQLNDTQNIADALKSEYKVEIELIVNKKFQEVLAELREVARKTKEEMDSSVMRYLQVEEHLKRHLRSFGMKEPAKEPSPPRAA